MTRDRTAEPVTQDQIIRREREGEAFIVVSAVKTKAENRKSELHG